MAMVRRSASSAAVSCTPSAISKLGPIRRPAAQRRILATSRPEPPAILAKEGVTIDPTVKEQVWAALTSLASSPVEERAITGLTVLLQSTALKQALQPYCVGGSFGRLLDAEAEQLGFASVQVFETEGLIGAGVAPAVLTCSSIASRDGSTAGRPSSSSTRAGSSWTIRPSPSSFANG
ncbi:hypothetical protein A5906_18630 [Bradyrhizobium sacchari]|nr:hypothetical protein A5906_18630 [Bradyrhizobium sacchari]